MNSQSGKVIESWRLPPTLRNSCQDSNDIRELTWGPAQLIAPSGELITIVFATAGTSCLCPRVAKTVDPATYFPHRLYPPRSSLRGGTARGRNCTAQIACLLAPGTIYTRRPHHKTTTCLTYRNTESALTAGVVHMRSRCRLQRVEGPRVRGTARLPETACEAYFWPLWYRGGAFSWAAVAQ